MPRIKSLPKRVKTIDDLLEHDSVASVLHDVVKRRAKIQHITVIWHEDKEGDITWQTTLTPSSLVSTLERVKFNTLLEVDGGKRQEPE